MADSETENGNMKRETKKVQMIKVILKFRHWKRIFHPVIHLLADVEQ
jgi:hypothetical protein